MISPRGEFDVRREDKHCYSSYFLPRYNFHCNGVYCVDYITRLAPTVIFTRFFGIEKHHHRSATGARESAIYKSAPRERFPASAPGRLPVDFQCKEACSTLVKCVVGHEPTVVGTTPPGAQQRTLATPLTRKLIPFGVSILHTPPSTHHLLRYEESEGLHVCLHG